MTCVGMTCVDRKKDLCVERESALVPAFHKTVFLTIRFLYIYA
jgi:hypothetical protein